MPSIRVLYPAGAVDGIRGMQQESAGSILGANSRAMDDGEGSPDVSYCTSAKDRKRRPREDMFLVMVAREGISLRESASRFASEKKDGFRGYESCFSTLRIPGYW